MNIIDTETINRLGHGEACWVGLYDGAKLRELEFPKKFSDIFDFLLGGENRAEYYAWNVAFDFRAVVHPRFFKAADRLCLERLGIFDETIFAGGLKIKSIPGKMYEISDDKKRRVCLYDLRQFFGLSLAAASKKYLPAALEKKRLPPAWYSEMDKCLKGARRGRVLAYARQDLVSTHALGAYFESQLTAAKIRPRRLISCASLARDIFGRRLKAQRPPDPVNRDFERGFFGGRIETRLIGRIGACHMIDLGSAYPSVMAALPPLVGGTALKVAGAAADVRDPDFGSYHVTVEVPSHWLWGPLACRRSDGRVFYPVGRIETYCGLDGLRAVRAHKLAHIVHSGLEYYCQNRRPLLREIPRLYSARKTTGAGHAIKIALNSAYGITAERRDEYVHSDTSGQKFGRFFAAHTVLYGPCTNFIYAAAITEKIRIRIWETLHSYGPRAIFAATDGVLISGAPDIETPGGLGEWGLAGSYSSAVILGSGRYKLWADYYKLRGFSGDAQKHFTRLSQTSRPYCDIPILTTTTLREWAGACGEGDYNVLHAERRRLTLGDSKRHFPALPRKISECFKGRWESAAIIGE